MNRVIIINLNGNAYQLEESGYDALRAYLDLAARRLEGNPDRAEILADIEQAIADKFRSVLGVSKTVVVAKEVEDVITEMGPVEGATPDDASTPSASGAEIPHGGTAGADTPKNENGPQAVRRLYRMYPEGAMLSGVCNGLAAYFNVDVTIFRLLFVLVTWLWGVGIVVYVVAVIVVPLAKTPAEKSAAYGVAATAQEFIRRAREGYYEGMKTFQNKHARREWKRKFKQDMRSWKQNFQNEMCRNTQAWSPASPGMGPALADPMFWLVHTLITIVALFALYSLVAKGMMFGFVLPVGIPRWVGIVGLIVVWRLVAWPFKVMQWGYYYRRGQAWERSTGPFGSLGDFLASLGFLILAVWLLDRYVPQFHELLKQALPVLHQALDSAQGWLEKQ